MKLLRTVIILQERDLKLGWALWGPGGAREETLCLPEMHGLRFPLLPIPVDQAALLVKGFSRPS